MAKKKLQRITQLLFITSTLFIAIIGLFFGMITTRQASAKTIVPPVQEQGRAGKLGIPKESSLSEHVTEFAARPVVLTKTMVTEPTGGVENSRSNLLMSSSGFPVSPYIALMGTQAAIDQVAAPFVANGSLRLQHTYPSPAPFFAESPNLALSEQPPDLNLYAILTKTNKLTGVVSAVIDATTGTSVTWDSNTQWLSYTPGEIILTGDDGDIQTMENLLQVRGVDPQLITEISFSGLSEIIRFYSISPTTVLTTVRWINNQYSHEMNVEAEPNYFISAAPHIHGSPGGPQIQSGQPFTITSPLTETGQGTSAFIFDTIPYTLPVSTNAFVTKQIEQVSIKVWRPYALPTHLPQGPWNVPAHGTFVANRITVLAPDADIHLIQVLNEDGNGDLRTFLKALKFAHDQLVNNGSPSAVFNYSLTMNIPLQNDERGKNFGPPGLQESSALNLVLSYLATQQIVQVAAAGNDSAYENKPQPIRLPANHDEVMGITSVKRSNSAGQKRGKVVCYANRGEFAAWGGGVVPADGLCNTERLVGVCSANNLAACVTGWDPDSPNKYATSVGTSFAAPVISGLSLQLMEERIRANLATSALAPAGASPAGNRPTPAQIRRRLRNLAASNCDANQQESVIFSLEECRTYLPTVLKNP